MSKPARGTKRSCKSCGARFYDLERDPIVCPACGVTFTFDAPAPKAAPQRAPAPKKEPVKEEKPKPAPAADAPEIVSLDEVEAQEASDSPEVEDEEAIAEIEDDDDTDIPESDDKDAFLEEEDEPESDVKGIIGEPDKNEGAS